MSNNRQALTAMLPGLSDKFKSPDFDIRVMALIDLNKELDKINAAPSAPKPPSNNQRGPDPYAAEASEKVLTGLVLELLYDENSEVKNAAVACLANMAKRARPIYLTQIVDTIIKGIGSPDQKIDEEKRDIACLALKSVVAAIPSDGVNVDSAVKSIIECTSVNVTHPDSNAQIANELLQILPDVYNNFPVVISQSSELQTASLEAFRLIFTTPRLSVRKRAVPSLAAFIAVCPQQFAAIKEDMANGFAKGGETAQAWVAAVSGIAKTSSSSDVGALVADGGVVEVVLSQTENVDDADAIEGAMSALEVLALRCPREISSYVSGIVSRALQLVKYDPNYVDDDEDEDVDMDDEFDDDGEFDSDVYSDDEDDSWKIRRSSAKVLQALIGTRPDLILDFYKTAAPTLVSRFSEREESVRLEILAAVEALLKQTIAISTSEVAAGRNKRKRSEAMDEDTSEDTAVACLHELRPQIVKAILKQTAAKSVNTRQQSFVLLRYIVEALDGGLDNESDVICKAARDAIRTSDSTSPSLTIAVLSFLSSFFTHHAGRTYASHLEELTQVVVRCMKDKLQRVNFEAFAAASAIAKSIRPIHSKSGSASPLRAGFDQPVKNIFKVTAQVLGDNSVDSDVRARALLTLGDVFVHEGDALSDQIDSALPLISARLTNEMTAAAAVEVIGRLAESPLLGGSAFDAWLLDVVSGVVVYIRRNKHTISKASEFASLHSIVDRVGASLPAETASGLVIELTEFIHNASALEIIALVLERQPECRPSVDQHVLPAVMHEVKTSSNSVPIDALTAFFAAYVDGDADSATRLVPALIDNVKASVIPDASLGGTLSYSTTAKCIAAVSLHGQGNLAGILATFQRTLKSKSKTASEADIYLALLSVGEIGRQVDLSANAGLLKLIIDFFNNESEEVRSAAAFAAGNMAVGAPDAYLPTLINKVEAPQDDATRLLMLYAIKEVILHSPPAQLEKFTEQLWEPLFGDVMSDEDDSGDDGVRNVKAACIGKLTTAAPARFLPQLQKMLQSSSPQQRALVAASIRYTFIDASSSYIELIAPTIGEFLSLMKDDNLVVRRLAVAALNAAAQNTPSLIVDKLAALQPYLYKETEIKKELQREVQMGPWKVLEDDGLENRKAAYETLYTLLAHCFGKLDLPVFTERVLATLSDVNEIQTLGLMLLLRLAKLAPATVIPCLDGITDTLKSGMKNIDVKEDTIKQDLERKKEMQHSTMRTIVPLVKMSTAAQAPVFHHFVTDLLKQEEWKEYRDYQA